MRLDQEKTQAVVDKAIDLGVTLFDTADVYGGGQSEVMLGKALGDRRQDVIVATKFGSPMGEGPYKAGGSRRYIMAACEASLKRLGTDYIDLYQIHRPDASTPLEETMRALEDLVRSGKVRYIGHSNFAGWQAAEAHAVAKDEGGSRRSSRRRTSTACSTGRLTATWCWACSSTTWACCRTSRSRAGC